MNYLDHPLDAVALREGVRFVDEIILRGDGMKDLVIGEYPEGDGGVVKGEPQAKGTSDGVYGAPKGEIDQGKSVEGDPKHMLGLDKVRDNDEGMAKWLKGRLTSGYRKFDFCLCPFPPISLALIPIITPHILIATAANHTHFRPLRLLQNGLNHRGRRRQWSSPSSWCSQPSRHRC
jgi:hypothetical protein